MPEPDRSRPSQGNGLIALAILGAALIVSWGSSRSEPRYELAGSGDFVVRLDTDSGAMLACNQQQCRQIEAPARAKTFGPLSVVVGGRDQEAVRQVDRQVEQQRQVERQKQVEQVVRND